MPSMSINKFPSVYCAPIKWSGAAAKLVTYALTFVVSCDLLASSFAVDANSQIVRTVFDSRSYSRYTYDSAGNITSITTRPPPTLDVDGDGASTSKDALLLLRYLLGYRGSALVAGVTLGAGRPDAAGVETFLSGALSEFDLLGRTSPAPTAMQDGLILARIMLGVPDTALLTGIGVPASAQFNSAALIRGNVNAVFGTSY